MGRRGSIRARSTVSACTAAFILATALGAGVFVTATPAGATFPGANGKIAFYLFTGDRSPILSMDADGTNRTVLAPKGQNSSPAWSADGTKIAYASQGVGLMTMNANGTGKTLVVADTRRHDFIEDPSWSPDGTKLVFDASPQDGSQPIFVVNSDGTGLSKIDSRPRYGEFDPDWSPDGLRIVFVAFDGSGIGSITTMDPDGGNRLSVTQGFGPSWSPDGSQITFEGGSSRYDVFVVNTNGTGRTRLTDTPHRWEYTPVFSPDGTHIAYSHSISKSVSSTDDVWIMNANGRSPTQITDTPRKDEYALSWQAV